MASGIEVTQSLESSASTKTCGIEARAIGADAPEVYYSAITSKKPATRATARRSGLSSADATVSLADAAYTGNLIDLGNSIHAAFHCRFSNSAGSCTVFFALYDEAGSLLGITRDYSFSAGPNTDGTLYLSVAELVDLHAAAKYFPVLKAAPVSGTVNIMVEHL